MHRLSVLGTYVDGKQVIFEYRSGGIIVFAIDGNAREPIPVTELAEALSDCHDRGGDPTPVVDTLAAQGVFSEAGELALAELAREALANLGMPVIVPEMN